jgi:hypothetical protein
MDGPKLLDTYIYTDEIQTSHTGCCCISCVLDDFNSTETLKRKNEDNDIYQNNKKQKKEVYNCDCDVCVNRQFGICETKQQQLIKNLEKEIEEKNKLLYSMKYSRYNNVINNIKFEYN